MVRTAPTDPWRCGDFGGRNKAGALCGKAVLAGTKRCDMHSGMTREKAKAKGAVVVELRAWGLTEQQDLADPGLTLLRLVTQSAIRADRYAAELARVVELERGELQKALVGEVWVTDEHGTSHKAGEYIRALTRLEADERDRCANFATKAIAAGLAERQVRMAERMGDQLAAAFVAVVAALGHSPDDPTVRAVIAAQLGAVFGDAKQIEGRVT